MATKTTKQNFKEKIGAWLWSFQSETETKDAQFAILDTANRLQKGEDIVIDRMKPSGEALSKLLELRYIIDAHSVEFTMLLGLLIGEPYTDDIDEHLS